MCLFASFTGLVMIKFGIEFLIIKLSIAFSEVVSCAHYYNC